MMPQSASLQSNGPQGHPIWLSGAVLTLLNKLVLPILWVAAIGGAFLWVFLQTGRISIRPGFGFICAFALLATVFGMWMTARLQRVGYCGKELVVANYWREARIPFEQVAAVEPVWWYRGRMVRIRFRERTPFGYTVYYLPKWGPIRCLFAAPDRELREIIFSGSASF